MNVASAAAECLSCGTLSVRPHPEDVMLTSQPFGRLRVRVVSYGPRDAPPLLLVHGLMTSSYSWRYLFERLGDRHRLTAPDLPDEAFAEYRAHGLPQVVCEEKHMGSRAIVVVCRDADAARERFGIDSGETGAITTRTGRPFLANAAETEAALSRVRTAAGTAGLWDELGTDWLVLDCELMPWSARPRLRRPGPDRPAARAQPGPQALACPCASSRSASRRWSASCAASRCTACTSASPAS